MKRACVIGWPIAHSRSPLIHGYWLRTYGIDGSYTKVPVRPEELARFLASLKDQGFAGCNVTVPHKEAAFAAAPIKTPSAVAIGSANTLWLEGDALACANTDTYGFTANLDWRAPNWRNAKGPALVLGAGCRLRTFGSRTERRAGLQSNGGAGRGDCAALRRRRVGVAVGCPQ